MLPVEDISRRYYLRYNVVDRPHTIADVTDILGRHAISIASVMQREAPEVDAAHLAESIVPLVIMTHRTTEGRMRAADEDIARLECVRTPRVRMSVDA